MTNSNLEKELWQTAVSLRGMVAPAEYKSYVLPLLFMRYLSLRYEQRYTQLTLLLKDRRSEYYTGDPDSNAAILADPVEYASHKDMLGDALRQYNNRTITAQEVVEVMRRIRGDQQAEVQRQRRLGLNDEEIAFYGVIALGEEVDLHQTDEWIADLVRQVVKAVRDHLQVDWTKPHRSNIEAEVQSAVGRVLRRNQIRGEQFEFLRARLMKQARATYERWPVVM